MYSKTDVTFFDVGMLFFVTGLLMFAVWGEPNIRSLLLFMGLIFAMQIFVRVRWRQGVKCPHCNFDPVLYKKNPETAAEKVRVFLEQRKSDPMYMLKPKPQIKVRVEKSDRWRENLPSSQLEAKASDEDNTPSHPVL